MKQVRAEVSKKIHKDMKENIKKLNKKPHTRYTQDDYIGKAIELFNEVATEVFEGNNNE